MVISPPAADVPHARHAAERAHPKLLRALWLIAVLAIVAAVAQGLVLRAWYIGHIPITSDEAVGGLMAIGIQHGQLPALYWGQTYGGVEPYLTALLFFVLPTNGVTLQLTAVLLDVAATVVIWRLALRLLTDRVMAAGVAAVAFLIPLSTIIDLSQVYGFRGVTFLATFVVLLLATRIEQGSDTLLSFAVLGLVGGIGWWSSPEIVYGLVGALFIAAVPLWRSGGASARLARLGAAVAAFLIGSAPWWWVSFHDHFGTLSAKMSYSSTFSGRLGVFFNDELPLQFGLIRFNDPVGLLVPRAGIRHDAAVVVIVIVVVAAAFAAIRAGGARRGIGLTMLVTPLLFATSPATWYWVDGRYGVYLTPLLLLTLGIGLERLLVWTRLSLTSTSVLIAGRSVVIVVLTLAMAYTSWQFGWWSTTLASSRGPLLSGYTASDGEFKPLAEALAADGIRTGWADYWNAYRLDFLSGAVLHLSPTPNDSERNKAYGQEARQSSSSIWLIVGPPNAAKNGPALNDPAPGLQTWGTLRQRFIAHHISWNIREIRGVWIIAPTTAVNPSAIGLGAGPHHTGN